MPRKKALTQAQLEQLTTNELIYQLLAERVGAVNPHEVLYADRVKTGKDAGKWTVLLGGKKLTALQAQNLRAEAQTLRSLQLWKVFTETLAHDAELRMFKKAQTERDLDWGKAVLYAISIFETIVTAAAEEHVQA